MALAFDVILYVSLVFTALFGVLLQPDNSEQLLVITPSKSSSISIYDVLHNTDARLISIVSEYRFIVENSGNNLVEKLYENGAFLVVSAASVNGCNAPVNTKWEN